MDRRVKIMVVEDDEVLAKEICLFLEKWGYELVLAREFSDIIGEFAAHRPQLILLDINLPYYDGFYWCSQIRQISDVPILFISSRNDDRDQIMAIAQGGRLCGKTVSAGIAESENGSCFKEDLSI